MADTIKFKYVFDKNYNPKYANGAYGGVTTRGEIAANFYLERAPLPYSTTHDLSEGVITKQLAVDPDDLNKTVIRFVDTGVVFSLQSAIDFHEWLGKKIVLLRERQKIAQKKLDEREAEKGE